MDVDTQSQLFDEDDAPECEWFEESDVTRLQVLEDIEKEARDIIELLKEDLPMVRRIRARIPRHIAAIDRLAHWCRIEINAFGLWREDEADFEEIYDAIEAEVGSITKNLTRDTAMSLALDSHELAQCTDFAASVLAGEQYLSGAELDFLDDVVMGEIFDTRRLLQIAGNHERWFKAMD